MLVADSQIHLWKAETPDRPWLKGARERMTKQGHQLDPYLIEQAIVDMDEAGVDRAVIVPPSWEGDRVDYGIEANERYPDRFCTMARIPQNKPEEAKAMMRDWKSIPGIKGVRLTFHRPQDRNWMIDGTADWYWPFAEELGVPTMVLAPIWKAELGEIAKRHPGLKLIVDHMGILSRSVDESISHWTEETEELSIHPNVYVKVSAVPSYSSHPFPYSNITPIVKRVVDAFGANRCFWGTDITRTGHLRHITYKQTVEHFTKHMGFTDAQLDQIMGKALCDCIGWKY